MPGSAARCRIPSEIARVVAGADRVEAERKRTVKHRGELDLLVAAQARVGGAARGVLGDEILHHVAVTEIARPCPTRRTGSRSRRRPAGRPGRPPACSSRGRRSGRTTGSRTTPDRRQGHLVTRVHRTSRGSRGVHSARHRREHPKTTHRPQGYALSGAHRATGCARMVRVPLGPSRGWHQLCPRIGAGGGGWCGALAALNCGWAARSTAAQDRISSGLARAMISSAQSW